MSFLATIGVRAWGYMAAAAVALFGLMLALGKAKQAGRDEVATAVNKHTGETATRMAEAAVQAPKGEQDVAKDLRSGKF